MWDSRAHEYWYSNVYRKLRIAFLRASHQHLYRIHHDGSQSIPPGQTQYHQVHSTGNCHYQWYHHTGSHLYETSYTWIYCGWSFGRRTSGYASITSITREQNNNTKYYYCCLFRTRSIQCQECSCQHFHSCHVLGIYQDNMSSDGAVCGTICLSTFD